MAYCSGCGKVLEEGSQFCSGCGMSASRTHAAAQATPSAQPALVVVQPKRGWWLAIKGFLYALILGVIFVKATDDDTRARAISLVLAFGSGVTYIVINLRRWKKNNEVVTGAGGGWAVAGLLLLACFANLGDVFSGGRHQTSAFSDRSASSSPSPAPDPKEILLNKVKLDFRWHKDGFGNVMIADFTLKNPTQYRFKDFEIKCIHSAPSGTQIDSNTQTIYEVVEPRSTKVVKDMNMGFINSQASKSDCEIIDLVLQ
jgi:hypothetical protein